MSKEAIIERILSDAEAESAAIIAEANARAEETVAQANARAEARRAETEAELAEKSQRIRDGRAAAARLDSAKILLAEKRRVLDVIYARAFEKLLALSEKESLTLVERLLKENAANGEEIVFAKSFAYAEEATKLSVIKERGLKISSEKADIDGGFLLRGEACDKDLSFGAILSLDREEHQAELAQKLFRENTVK